jgi:hypothetical protein
MEDTLTIARTMRAASPPASAADILEATANNRRYNRPGTKNRQKMLKFSGSLNTMSLSIFWFRIKFNYDTMSQSFENVLEACACANDH